MNGTSARAARRGGSSFGTGPRRGTDPEGGERSAWKGLCGPSGLNLDHSRIPDIQKVVYGTLVPLVVEVEKPMSLSQFTQKCCDVLLPLLERQQELTAHEFKSQWGRLNEFVCPELARRAGLADSGYDRQAKEVRLDLRVPSSSTPSPAPAPPRLAPPAPSHAAVTPNPVPRPAPAVVGTPSPSPGTAVGARPPAVAGPPPGLAVPIPLAATAGGPGVVPFMAAPPAPCGYCQGPHAMKHCADFHGMLQSIYQAGYQHGMAAAQQAQRTLHASPQLAAGPSEGGVH
ncbi:hypothetical protein C2E21_7631 [Chlorella sorokiniana]|uniref:Uncharacterized protein n=1 Tax=Chlorella sorokiniana TaxID=3076 RepID=A0A2P6TH62_CHLSO|nr:hypothetical protein C2E21_7631 [Chlorella sorokiniana]|eukprot:PRW33620.1 hypothetical protein C2E21_7631 [Chlorella sorokiniana]